MIYAKDLRKVGGDDTTLVYWGDFEVDSAADFADFATTFPDTVFVMSSKAHSISDNKKYMLDSNGNWIEQDDSPFSDVYTKSQVDSLLSDIDATISLVDHRVDDVQGEIGKLIDEGAKNILDWSATSSTIQGVTFTVNDDKTVSTSGTANQRAQKPLNFNIPSTLPAGRYVLSGCPAGGAVGSTVKYCLYVWDSTASSRVSLNDTGDGVTFDWIPDSTHQYNIGVDIRAGNNADGLVFKPMITEAWKYALSQAFVPYSLTNAELTKLILNS